MIIELIATLIVCAPTILMVGLVTADVVEVYME